MPEAMTPPETPPCGCGTPAPPDAPTCYCCVDDMLRVIRRRYSLALLNAISSHAPVRYRQLATVLPQASSSTLVETLGALEAAGLIVRRASDVSPASTYALTENGVKLLNRLRPLLEEIQR